MRNEDTSFDRLLQDLTTSNAPSVTPRDESGIHYENATTWNVEKLRSGSCRPGEHCVVIPDSTTISAACWSSITEAAKSVGAVVSDTRLYIRL